MKKIINNHLWITIYTNEKIADDFALLGQFCNNSHFSNNFWAIEVRTALFKIAEFFSYSNKFAIDIVFSLLDDVINSLHNCLYMNKKGVDDDSTFSQAYDSHENDGSSDHTLYRVLLSLVF